MSEQAMFPINDIDGILEDGPQQPNDCDFCSNNFLSHTIHICPDCGLCYCDRCWNTEHHCYDDDDDDTSGLTDATDK